LGEEKKKQGGAFEEKLGDNRKNRKGGGEKARGVS